MEDSNWILKKQDFVTGLNGSSLFETTLISSLSPALIFLRTFLLGVIPASLVHKYYFRYVFDYIILVLPLVIGTTILSDNVAELFLSIIILGLTCLALKGPTFKKEESEYACYVSPSYYKNLVCDDVKSLQHPSQSQLFRLYSTEVSTSKLPFLDTYRFYVNIATCVCILAVDFPVFPRRLAKVENFGTGLMDLGVGSYIISNALVCKEARHRYCPRQVTRKINQLNFKALLFEIISCWPLFLLGLLRLISVKLSGYQEHVTEYGVYWNFFFTLGSVKVFAAIVLFFIGVEHGFLLSFIIGVSYQIALSYPSWNLTSILLNEERTGIIMKNKEGFASCLGYLSLYFAAAHLGSFLFKERATLGHWTCVAKQLLFLNLGLWTALYICNIYIQPVSRRLANLSYIVWLLSHATFFLCAYLVIDIITVLNITKCHLPLHSMPNRWVLFSNQKNTYVKINYAPESCVLSLIKAVNRNQLLYFLLCNLLTGVINYASDTLSVGNLSAAFIICVYSVFGTFLIWCLHVNDITLKFW
ncbi:glucosaminyl-phosphatidylinositol-acyltransferase PIGW-like [Clavelina lepadiformis]|uniref:glucosaminyl-phosphatidylinositol- acyltransferase PIGW-like n=1 Tax=Clavelina lepadiformis TaxID=159417 RepID=UPI004043673F